MKTIIAKQSFKTVSAKQAESNPAVAMHLGKKRPTVEFQLPEYEKSDLPALTDSDSDLLLVCLNNAIADLAKQKFAATPQWDFVPTLDDLSLVALRQSFESVSRGRALTLESAGKLAAFLGANIAEIVRGIQQTDPTYKPEQCQAMIAVIAKYTAHEAKPAEFLAKVLLRLEQIAESIVSNESLAEEFSADASLSATYDALIRKFSKNVDEDITEDAL